MHARELYGLQPGQRVLGVGCAKGFLLHDLRQAAPGLSVASMSPLMPCSRRWTA